MEPFKTIKSIPAPLAMINVDTDMIIPKQFLKTIKRSGLGKNLFHELLPKLCNSLDKSRLYWPSSPGYDLLLPKTGQELNRGDVHYWGVWHGGDELSSFSENVGRFMSEFGMQSFPSPVTVDYFCPSNEQEINSDIIKSHQKLSLIHISEPTRPY